MTVWMDRVLRMSVSGFLVSTMRSAALPGAISPRESTPSNTAAFLVAALRASLGLIPAATSSSSSRCSL